MWNDRRLARRAARGDSDAFEAIFRRYQQDLYRYCVAILGNPQDAQDALQNTMVKALRNLPGEDRQIELKPWLYRVAHNESIELRRRGRPTSALEEDLPAPGGDVEQTAADRIRLRDLLTDVGELPDRHRGALVMRELAGLDFEEIGAALETSPRAARQVLYEARQGLQQMSEGREMECDAVTAKLSEQDGRVARRRDLRAHLRDCAECRRFDEGIRTRTETLAGIAPLPALAAAAIAKGALAGGGAAAGAGSAGGTGGTGATGGAAGLAGGAAKVASTGAILKSTVAIVAVVGAGAVAVDHSDLLHRGSSSGGGTTAPATVAEPASAGAGTESQTSRGTERGVLSRYLEPTGKGEVDLSRATAVEAKPSPGRRVAAAPRPRASTARAESATPRHEGSSPKAEASTPTATPVAPPVAEPPEADSPSVEQPDHPEHPVHPAHPETPGRAAHPSHPAHPTHPPHPSEPVESPAEPPVESKPRPEPGSPPKSKDAPEATAPPESTDEAAATEAATPEEPEPPSHPTPPTEPPGQAKK